MQGIYKTYKAVKVGAISSSEVKISIISISRVYIEDIHSICDYPKGSSILVNRTINGIISTKCKLGICRIYIELLLISIL